MGGPRPAKDRGADCRVTRCSIAEGDTLRTSFDLSLTLATAALGALPALAQYPSDPPVPVVERTLAIEFDRPDAWAMSSFADQCLEPSDDEVELSGFGAQLSASFRLGNRVRLESDVDLVQLALGLFTPLGGSSSATAEILHTPLDVVRSAGAALETDDLTHSRVALRYRID